MTKKKQSKFILYNKYGLKLQAKQNAKFMRTTNRWRNVQVRPIKKYGLRAWGIYTRKK